MSALARMPGIRGRIGRSSRLPVRRAFGERLLSVSAVTARRGDRTVVDGVDLEVSAGEVVALVGPNGAGKSSLLAAITGDLELASGEVTIDGRSASEWSPVELALRRAVLPQHATMAFPFRAAEVVHMARAPWSSAGAADDDERCVAEALADADATHLAARAVTTLSGGERARVSMARLLAQRAQLLLLDEPTAALDIGHQEMVMACVRDRAAAGDGAVVVVHDLSLAAAYADRVVVIHDGRVVADGAPLDVFRPALLVDVYQHPIDVIAHPGTGAPLVIPVRTTCVDGHPYSRS